MEKHRVERALIKKSTNGVFIMDNTVLVVDDSPSLKTGVASVLAMALMSGGMNVIMPTRGHGNIPREKTQNDVDMLKKADEKRKRKCAMRLKLL